MCCDHLPHPQLAPHPLTPHRGGRNCSHWVGEVRNVLRECRKGEGSGLSFLLPFSFVTCELPTLPLVRSHWATGEGGGGCEKMLSGTVGREKGTAPPESLCLSS